jgi:hypothetical protein
VPFSIFAADKPNKVVFNESTDVDTQKQVEEVLSLSLSLSLSVALEGCDIDCCPS